MEGSSALDNRRASSNTRSTSGLVEGVALVVGAVGAVLTVA